MNEEHTVASILHVWTGLWRPPINYAPPQQRSKFYVFRTFPTFDAGFEFVQRWQKDKEHCPVSGCCGVPVLTIFTGPWVNHLGFSCSGAAAPFSGKKHLFCLLGEPMY